MACDITTIQEDVACFQCLSSEQQDAIIIYLLCQIMHDDIDCGDPAALNTLAECFQCANPNTIKPGFIVKLCEAWQVVDSRSAGDCTATSLVDATKCIACLPPARKMGLLAYLWCELLENYATLATPPE